MNKALSQYGWFRGRRPIRSRLVPHALRRGIPWFVRSKHEIQLYRITSNRNICVVISLNVFYMTLLSKLSFLLCKLQINLRYLSRANFIYSLVLIGLPLRVKPGSQSNQERQNNAESSVANVIQTF